MWAQLVDLFGYISVRDHGAYGDDPGDGSGHDDSAAFASAFAACLSQRKGLLVPDTGAAYRIDTQVNISPGRTGRTLDVVGGGTILANVNGSSAVLSFANIERVRLDLNIRGLITNPSSPTRVRFADCLRGFEFISCRMSYWSGRAFWIGASEAIIYCNAGALWCRDFLMEGAAATVANIRAVNYSGLVVESGNINDIGYFGASTGGSSVGQSNANQAIPGAWIRADDVSALQGGFQQQTPTFRQLFLDETASRKIQIAPTTRLHACLIEDVRSSACHVGTAQPAYDIANVDRFEMRRSSAMTTAQGGGQSDAVSLAGVSRAWLDSCRFATVANDCNRIVTDANTPALIMSGMTQGTDYRTLSADNATTVTTYP